MPKLEVYKNIKNDNEKLELTLVIMRKVIINKLG